MAGLVTSLVEFVDTFLSADLLKVIVLVAIGLFVIKFLVLSPKEQKHYSDKMEKQREDYEKALIALEEAHSREILELKEKHAKSMKTVVGALKESYELEIQHIHQHTLETERRHQETYNNLTARKSAVVDDFIKATNAFRELIGELGTAYDKTLTASTSTIENNTKVLGTILQGQEIEDEVTKMQLQSLEKDIRNIELLLREFKDLIHQIELKIK